MFSSKYKIPNGDWMQISKVFSDFNVVREILVYYNWELKDRITPHV